MPVRIVLVEPIHPGNVGATARAMRNFGLSDLVVVDPPAFDTERARWMAPGCDDLVDGIRLVADVDEALDGVHRAVATTARHRRDRQPVIGPATLAEQVWGDDRLTAVLFGREDFGLSREAVARCDTLVRIPTFEHASLNLAQAVLIVVWALYDEGRSHGAVRTSGRMVGGHTQRSTASYQRGDRRDDAADLPTIEPAVEEMVDLLERVGYTRGTRPDKVALTGRTALQRANLTIREVEALRGMAARIQWALDHPGMDWRKKSKG